MSLVQDGFVDILRTPAACQVNEPQYSEYTLSVRKV